MRVVHLASEAQPWAKTGGLADVLGSLPPALASRGADVTVMLPAYRTALRTAGTVERLGRVHAPVGSRMEPVDVLRVANAPVPTLLLAAPRYFDREGLYGDGGRDHPDNAERFVVFCRAALEWLRELATPPDVLHAHDWQAAPALAFLRGTQALYPELAATRTVQTVHNLAYQGRFWAADWHLLNLDPRWFTAEFLEFHGQINFLKAGLVFADAITTVSPRYAREIQTPALGEGLDGVLRARAERVHGILNGIDTVAWDPAGDPALPAHYDATTLDGKAACRAALRGELGLTPDEAPALVAMVTRLAEQKGIDTALGAAWGLVGGGAIQLAVLGSGDPHWEHALHELAARHPGRVAVRIGFDEPLARRLEAGADLFWMPSRFEPCGLTQLYSLRYGAVPIVHETGGLADTVTPWDAETGHGTGFLFRPCTTPALVAATRAALAIRTDTAAWRRLIANGMACDFSWDRSAAAYVDLYAALSRE
ncbi:MAG: glycogen synthase GlgA [bacterium]|nr:glycogen synthase GlgA [bacterium]